MKEAPLNFEIFKRIQAVTRTRTQTALAEILEIRQSSISDAKRRQSVPGAWYITLFEKLGVNPDWLKSGIGPVYLRTEAGYIPGDGDGTPRPPACWTRLCRSLRLSPCTPCAATTRETGQPWPRSGRQAASSCLGHTRERA